MPRGLKWHVSYHWWNRALDQTLVAAKGKILAGKQGEAQAATLISNTKCGTHLNLFFWKKAILQMTVCKLYPKLLCVMPEMFYHYQSLIITNSHYSREDRSPPKCREREANCLCTRKNSHHILALQSQAAPIPLHLVPNWRMDTTERFHWIHTFLHMQN